MKLEGKKKKINCESLVTHLAWVMCLVAQSCLTLRPHGLQRASLLCPSNSPGKNTGVGSCSLLQGIFPTQVSRIAGGFFTI